MRRPLLLTLTLLAVTAAGAPSAVARAADTNACDSAYEQAQTLRDGKKLTAARAPLMICARASCPGFMTKDCTAWLAETEARIPSVVLVATDANGLARANVQASVDGGAPRKLDGTSWEVDPGEHTFTFILPFGPKETKTLMVVEGQKDQRVTVAVGASPPSEPTPTPAESTGAVPVTDQDRSTGSSFPYRGVGYVGLGVGGAAILVGAIFGVDALATKGSHCNGDACTGGEAGTALSLGNVSTGAIVAGALLAGGGLTLVLLAPKTKDAQSATLRAAPLTLRGGGGFALGGDW